MHSLMHVDGSPIRHLNVAAVGALALLLGNGVVLAQDDDRPGPVEEQVSPSPDEQDEPDSYPEKMRNFGGNPTDIDEDLDNSLQLGSRRRDRRALQDQSGNGQAGQ